MDKKEYKKKWDIENVERNKTLKRKWYLANKERLSLEHIEYYKENKDKIKSRAAKWNKDNPNRRKEIFTKAINKLDLKQESQRKRDYYLIHKDKVIKRTSEWARKRRKENIEYKLACRIRSRFNKSIKGNFKSGSSIKDLGCTVKEFKSYIESLFKPGMTWDNWSYSGWHLDHIIPLSLFNLTNREELLKACHYTNLQPLWAKENMKKRNKIMV